MLKRFWSPIMCRFETHQLTIEADERAKNSVTQLRGLVDDRVKDGLDVRRRAGDRLEDRARRDQVTIACLQLLEQPDILDGDDRLVGECLKERNLRIGEEPRLRMRYCDRADRFALAQHRGGQN